MSDKKPKQQDIAKFYETTTQTMWNWKNGNEGQKRRYAALKEYYVNHVHSKETE